MQHSNAYLNMYIYSFSIHPGYENNATIRHIYHPLMHISLMSILHLRQLYCLDAQYCNIFAPITIWWQVWNENVSTPMFKLKIYASVNYLKCLCSCYESLIFSSTHNYSSCMMNIYFLKTHFTEHVKINIL